MKDMITWFEIPVKDLKRAMKFYSKVLDVEVEKMENGPMKMASFPYSKNTISGALVEDKNHVSDKGPLVYLNGGEDLSVPLKKVKSAGGRVLQEKTSLGEYGFMATFKDSEGNRVALHSMK